MESDANTSTQAAHLSAQRAFHYISDESALGQRLNVAVNQQQRADFGYLLAMLSDNVLEHSATAFAREPNSAANWQLPFTISPAAPLVCGAADLSSNPSADFHRSRIDWRLQQALCPEGLNLVNDPHHIPAQVMGNCAHFVQQRYSLEQGKRAPDSTPESSAGDLVDIIDRLRGVVRAAA